jgi:hypothetical protein
MKDANLVGADVVEVAPAYDPTTNTAQSGAQMLFEIVSLMAFFTHCVRQGLGASPLANVQANQDLNFQRRVGLSTVFVCQCCSSIN